MSCSLNSTKLYQLYMTVRAHCFVLSGIGATADHWRPLVAIDSLLSDKIGLTVVDSALHWLASVCDQIRIAFSAQLSLVSWKQ